MTFPAAPWYDGPMLVFALVLSSGWLTPTAEAVLEGDAKIHDLIPQVAANRGMSLGGYAGGLAAMGCGDLGRSAWLRVDGRWVGRFLVVDCAQRGHYGRRVEQGDVAELDRRTWDVLGLPLRPHPVALSFVDPRRLARPR